jgi:hypothetical protein
MNKILVGVIVFLILHSVFGKSEGCNPKARKSDTTVLIDTQFSVHDTIIYKKMKGRTLHDTIPTAPEYIADTNYPKLLAQYNSLLKKYTALVEVKDTINIDTIGYISITDTVNQNSIKGRSVRTNYKIPTITNTITIQQPDKPKAHLYYGGGVDVTQMFAPIGAHGGLILKTKKDQLIGLSVGTGANGEINYRFTSYWKIKLK